MEWSAADSILSGFELGEVGDSWRVGDRVLLGIRSRRDKQTTLRYLLVELVDGLDTKTPLAATVRDSQGTAVSVPLAPPTYFTRLTVYDEGGKQLVQSSGTLPDRLMNNGVYGLIENDAASTLHLPRGSGFYGMVSLVQFSTSSSGNSALSSMTREVIGMPSVWAMLTHRPTLELNAAEVTHSSVESAGSVRSAALIGVDVSLNQELMLQLHITAIESRPPIGLVSGILSVEGQHPSDPARQLTVKALAARRGTGAGIKAFILSSLDRFPDDGELNTWSERLQKT